MAKIYEKYENNAQYCWYDSTNVLFSKCFDNNPDLKALKVVFKNGATYMYKDVFVDDYTMFRDSDSTGSSFNKYIVKKYKGVRIQDTDLVELKEQMERSIEEKNVINETKYSDIGYTIEYNNGSGEFILKMGDKIIYQGIEGNVSIIKLFKSMKLNANLIANSDLKLVVDDELLNLQ